MTLQIKQEIHGIKKTDIKTLACSYCGRRHPAKNCPAYGKKCANYNNYNHFAAVCRTRSKNKEEQNKKENGNKIDSVQKEDRYSDCSHDIVVDLVSKWVEVVNINGTNIRFKLDSGADCNTLSLKLYYYTTTTKWFVSYLILLN